MARPRKLEEQRQALLPVVAQAFVEAENGRISTREIASKCGVKQAILYRLWPGGKKEMFIAVIGFVWKRHGSDWQSSGKGDAKGLIEEESKLQGSHGLYRIVFRALAQSDDPDIKLALQEMYRGYAAFIKTVLESSTSKRGKEAEIVAWSLLGLGTMVRIGILLDLKELDVVALLKKSGDALLR